MIVQNAEAVLLVSMVGLYLYDSAQFLTSDEALLSKDGKDRWSARFGSHSFLLRGKEPCLPNPLLPHRPIFRVFWSIEGLARPTPLWTPPGNEYGILALPIWMMAFALFVLIPLGLFSHLGYLAITAGIIFFYFNAILALTLIWRNRGVFQITATRFAALAFESLTCPPFALNITRHVSLTVQPCEDFLSIADRLLTTESREAALKQVIDRIKNEIDWEDEGTDRAEMLKSHLQYLSREIDKCRALNS